MDNRNIVQRGNRENLKEYGTELPSEGQRQPIPAMAVGIVNYNTREALRSCLASLASEAPAEVIILDNGSSDGSVEMVKSCYPDFTLIANETNPGYGAGANQIVSQCSAEYILLLNSDTRLRPGTLQILSSYLDQHKKAALVGPRLVNMDGTLQVSCFPFPSPLHTFLGASSAGLLIGTIPFLREVYLPTWSHSYAREVPWVLGAALAIRRRAFDAIGGFDESYFMYSEEVDLCYRLQLAGWAVHFTPEAVIEHTGGASTVQNRSDMEIQRYASTRQFYRRHYSRSQMLQLRLIATYSMIRNMIRDRVRLTSTRQTRKRAEILEDLSIWRRILREQWRA